MKKTSITASIALAILLITGALFRVFAPETSPEEEMASGDEIFSSLLEDEDDPDRIDPAAASIEGRDESAKAVVKLDELKKKMADDGVDFGAIMKQLEERLRNSPDGKITEKEILGVIPPEYAEEFKNTINEMYYPGTINPKENRP